MAAGRVETYMRAKLSKGRLTGYLRLEVANKQTSYVDSSVGSREQGAGSREGGGMRDEGARESRVESRESRVGSGHRTSAMVSHRAGVFSFPCWMYGVRIIQGADAR